MMREGLGDLPANCQDRVQRGHRLLEDHADVAAAHLADLLLGQPPQVAAREHDLPLGDPSWRIRDQTEDRQRPGSLARPAFTDDRHRFAGFDGVGDAVDRRHDAGPGAKLGVQVSDF